MQVAKLRMCIWASFLNNSSSRWEAIFDSWEFSAALMDHISPIYRSDFNRCLAGCLAQIPRAMCWVQLSALHAAQQCYCLASCIMQDSAAACRGVDASAAL